KLRPKTCRLKAKPSPTNRRVGRVCLGGTPSPVPGPLTDPYSQSRPRMGPPRGEPMEITAAMVKQLRDSTGVGMMDCKKALAETNGDMEAAVDWLRTRGLAKAAKKADRVAAEGLVG